MIQRVALGHVIRGALRESPVVALVYPGAKSYRLAPKIEVLSILDLPAALK